jgi:hypothetical protein
LGKKSGQKLDYNAKLLPGSALQREFQLENTSKSYEVVCLKYKNLAGTNFN